MNNTIENNTISFGSNLIKNIDDKQKLDNKVASRKSSDKIKQIATTTTIAFLMLNQPFVRSDEIRTNPKESIKRIYTTSTNIDNYDSYIETSLNSESLPLEGEGDFDMSDNIKQKDLDNLEEKNNLKLETIDIKLENINSSIEDLKIMIKDMDKKINDQPTKEFVEKEISDNTVKYLLWLGAGLVAVAGFLAWYLPLVINVPS